MDQRLALIRCRLRKTLTRAWPEFALLMALSMTAIATISTYNLMTVQRRGRMRTITATLGSTIHHRLRVFKTALHNARSFILSRGITPFPRDEFTRFVRGLDLPGQVPGLRALDFVSLNQCVEEIDPRRRGAMRTARDTGQETLGERMEGATFEMFLPVFQPGWPVGDTAARRTAMRGWVRATFGVQPMLNEITTELRRVSGELGVEVYDGPVKRADARFFVSEADPPSYLDPVGIMRKYMSNHVWTIRVRPTPATFSGERPPVWLLIALLGCAASGWIYVTVKRSARAARTLQRSEGILSLVMNGVPALISYINADERYVYANLGYERITGVPRDEIIGRTVRDLLGEEYYRQFGGELRRALGGERAAFEHDRFKLDGVTRTMSGQYIPHRNVRGEVIGVVALVNDVTEERLAKEQLRTAAVENARLYAESQAINRVKDEFLATLSHELRTPLNVILGYSDILMEQDLDDTDRGYVEKIQRNARTQNQLIADLLDISAIINGKLSFSPALINLNEVVRDSVEGVSFAANAKGVVLTTEVGNRPCTINGDATRVQQIIWNLLSNAVKFTPRGGRVVIALRAVEPNFEIEVRDSGIGIDADFLPYVFDRFRQEDASRARRFGGLGLGLAIVRHLVEMHGGHIRVSSLGKDHGATFVVSFPRFERNLRLSDALA